MKTTIFKTALLLCLTFCIFTACDSDDDNAGPTVEFLDVVWTAEDATGSATIIFRSDNTWTSTNTITNASFSGEWSWIDEGNRIMKYGEFVFFGDTFSEFFRFSNITDTSVDVESTTQPNPNRPTNESYFTQAGTWTR